MTLSVSPSCADAVPDTSTEDWPVTVPLFGWVMLTTGLWTPEAMLFAAAFVAAAL